MSDQSMISESLDLAKQQMERLVILSLTLSSGGRANASMPESQEQEIDRWIFDLAEEAIDHIESARSYMGGVDND